MRTIDYETSRCVGMNHDTKQMMMLFCMLNDTTPNVVINSLLRQWYFHSLPELETQYPDKIYEWAEIREKLHKLKI